MKFTAVTDDGKVYIDGKAQSVPETAKLPADVHAIQWDGKRGEIEFKSITCESCGCTSKKQNETFTDFSPYQFLVDAFVVAEQEAAYNAA